MKMARSSTDSQHYSLKWNDYSTKMVAAFQSLRADQDFVDVTIACDSHHYEAHKMVLSACSPYFRSILKVNPCKHPIIILKDVSHSEMEKLLEFMYNGEVNIAQEYLPAFLKVAENLKIKGLAGSASEMEQLYNSTKNSSDSPNDKSFNNSAISNYSDNRIKDDIPNKPTVKKRKIDYHDMDDTTTTDRQIHNSILGASKALVVLKNEPFDEYMTEVVEKSSETDARAETVYSDMTQDSLAPREDGSSVLEDSSPHDNGVNSFLSDDLVDPLSCFNDSTAGSSSTNSLPNLESDLQWSSEKPRKRTMMTNPTARTLTLDSKMVGENFECSVCKKLLANKVSLYRHVRDQHTTINPVTCEICGRSFKNRNCKSTHKSTAHRFLKHKSPRLFRSGQV